MSPSMFSAASASEAARTLRELARLGELDRTGTSAPVVLHDLRSAALSMRQVVDQLAFAHTDPGLPAQVREAALATADELHQAGTVLDELTERLNAAEQAADQVTTIDTSPVRQWVPMANLHGNQAAEALHLLGTEGPEGAAVFLSQWDSGIDTDDQALDQRRTRAQLPLAAGNQAVTFDAYTIVANPEAGQIAMYRLADDLPSMAVIEAQDRLPATSAEPMGHQQGTVQPQTRRAARQQAESRNAQKPTPGRSWFDPPATGGPS